MPHKSYWVFSYRPRLCFCIQLETPPSVRRGGEMQKNATRVNDEVRRDRTAKVENISTSGSRMERL